MKTLYTLLLQQARWSKEVFGPYGNKRAEGLVDHAAKEVDEILADVMDLEEWIDLMIIAMDGAMCVAATRRNNTARSETLAAQDVEVMLLAKMEKNMFREWPAREDQVPGKAVEHIRQPSQIRGLFTLELEHLEFGSLIQDAEGHNWRKVNKVANGWQRTDGDASVWQVGAIPAPRFLVAKP